MKKNSLLIFSFVFFLCASAQRNVVLEQVRTFSMMGPVMQYLSLPDARSVFMRQLSDQLTKHKNAVLTDTTVRVIPMDNLKQFSNANVLFTVADTSTWHLYIDLYEYEPNTFYYSQLQYLPDSLLFKRARSVFQIGLILVNHQKNVIWDEMLTVCVSQGNSNGFGIIRSNLSLTVKGFTDMVNLSFGKLLDSANNVSMIEVKAAPAFYADNYILPEIGKHPVLQVKAQNDIFSYQRNAEPEMIRLGDTYYEEIITKGKKKNITEHSLLANAIEATGNLSSSEFVQLRQECRDVIRDKNYTMKLITEINPGFSFINQADVFTQFLPDQIHTLLKDRDTVARFAIIKNIGIPEKKIFLDKVTNGYDSSSVVTLGAPMSPRNVFYEYQIKGTIDSLPFAIYCADKNSLKEIYFNGKGVAVAKGIFSPERIAVFDASLDTEKLNQLLIIAFCKFFQ